MKNYRLNSKCLDANPFGAPSGPTEQLGNRDKGGKQFGSCCGLFSPMSRRRESSVCVISICYLSVVLLLMTGVKCQESFQREQYESLGGNAVLYLSHKEEGHSKISCFS